MTSKPDDSTAASTLAEEPQVAASSSISASAANGYRFQSNDVAGEEPLVKKRRTKNFQLREDLAKSRGSVTVHVPAFEPLTFDSWDDFIQTWNGYMTRTKTMYRRRSSSTTTYWNNKHKYKKYPVPEDFKYATMAYWCTHGCIQPSRGNGVRTHLHNRYTGCSARITADVVFEMIEGDPSKVHWLVRVRNQISQHNHRISDEIYNCYTNNSSVPDELLLGPDAEQYHKQEPHEAYEPSARTLIELDRMGVDSGFSLRSSPESKVNVKMAVITAAPTVSDMLLKEALANEHKMNMAASEMQPLLDELKNTSSRVIHKRLQDVSEMVAHLQAKWHQDRITEEAAQAHTIAPIASLSIEQTGATTNEAVGKATANSVSSIASSSPGAAYYLTPRVEHVPNEVKHSNLAAASTDHGSDGEAVSASSDRELQDKSGQVVGNQRGPSEAV